MIKVSVIGATGYAGEELTRLLLMHPEVKIVSLASKSFKGEKFSHIYNNFSGRIETILVEPNIKEQAKESDVLFLALPHAIASKEIDRNLLENTVVIDLGADFRLKDKNVYESWYNVKHGNPELLKEAVYGLPELNRKEIKKANLIANPGCYPTASILALAPLAKEKALDQDSLIIDAASGVSGAGRNVKLDYMYCSVDENYKAYGVTDHRHTPEIEQELSFLLGEEVILNFTPHLLPMQRGILATCYTKLNADIDLDELYRSFYRDKYFVRVLDSRLPETKYVQGSNYIDIGYKRDERTGRIIIISAIDNLIKGAAGQAIQNMNIRFNLPEQMGINMIPDLPI